MRKVFLKVFFIICLALSSLGSISGGLKAEPCKIEVTSGEDYTYEKIVVDGVTYWIVYDDTGRIVEIFPSNECGPGHGHGGN